MKIHLSRSMRTTWCGIPYSRSHPLVTTHIAEVTCKTCIKADAAEQRRNS